MNRNDIEGFYIDAGSRISPGNENGFYTEFKFANYSIRGSLYRTKNQTYTYYFLSPYLSRATIIVIATIIAGVPEIHINQEWHE